MTACTYAGTDRLNRDYEYRVELLWTTRSCHHLFGEVS